MKIKTVLFYTMFCVVNSFQSQATIVKPIEIEDEFTKSSSNHKSSVKSLTNESKSTNFTRIYKEYYSNDVLFAVEFKAHKPNKLFINTNLLSGINEAYQNYLINDIGANHIYSKMTYYKESFGSIKSDINLFAHQLREAAIKGVISSDEYQKLIGTSNRIDRKIERAKVEFALKGKSREKYFARFY